ncbi:MAG TPA: acetylglutamate kinase [Gaiellaceae bacterium]|jgi:acetylglutamate kinase|nr:acetylglutamate kinase [Gaiellaceae bacterium]
MRRRLDGADQGAQRETRLVVKVGGAVSGEVAERILELAGSHEVCVVHGAGPQISAEMARRGLEVEFVHGRRVTTAAGLEAVRDALARVNAELCEALGAPALPLFGDDLGLPARQVAELGLVGEPLPSRPAEVEQALALGRIPVVAPLAAGPLNVNADEAAAALAVGLGAARLLFLTDVPGVLVAGGVAVAIEACEAERLVGEGHFQGGIVPKLLAAVRAARGGVQAEIGETAVLA